MPKNLKSTLLGVFELTIFMPSFLGRFSASRDDAIRSFIFPAIVYPLVAMAFAYNQVTTPGANVMAAHAILSWGGLFLFYGILHALSRAVRRDDFFWQTVHVLNAQSLITFILLLPLVLPMVLMGEKIGTGGLTHYWIMVLLIGMAYKAYIIAYGLRLNLPLGGFLATVHLYISDITYKFLIEISPHDLI
jgi:hypothetical protein